MKAVLVFREKKSLPEGGFVETVIWRVPSNGKYPDGIKYRLAFIPAGWTQPAILYDNHHPKGHHKHIDGLESPGLFLGVPSLKLDFLRDIAQWRAHQEGLT